MYISQAAGLKLSHLLVGGWIRDFLKGGTSSEISAKIQERIRFTLGFTHDRGGDASG
jgi:tRNA nucleotidyltransferase/poly(A) polymerase